MHSEKLVLFPTYRFCSNSYVGPSHFSVDEKSSTRERTDAHTLARKGENLNQNLNLNLLRGQRTLLALGGTFCGHRADLFCPLSTEISSCLHHTTQPAPPATATTMASSPLHLFIRIPALSLGHRHCCNIHLASNGGFIISTLQHCYLPRQDSG